METTEEVPEYIRTFFNNNSEKLNEIATTHYEKEQGLLNVDIKPSENKVDVYFIGFDQLKQTISKKSDGLTDKDKDFLDMIHSQKIVQISDGETNQIYIMNLNIGVS
jgi:hypothetical protein